MNRLLRFLLFLTFSCLCLMQTMAQSSVTGIQGVVLDAETGEKLPFVQIYFLQSSAKNAKPSTIGTTSNMEGEFALSNTAGYTVVQIQMVGYKTETITLRKGQTKKGVKISLKSEVVGLKDVIVKPKHEKRKYKRKGNPAVELIKEVIAHKDSATIKTTPFYTADTYHRQSYAFDNFSPNFQKGFWRSVNFVQKYIDTTTTYHALTVSIRENLGKEYFQQHPHREGKKIERKRFFGLESLISTQTLEENMKFIFNDIDINDNDIKALMNHFVSPLSNTLAVSYYQYYILDTMVVSGDTCIDLGFVPVSSEGYGFTGHLYILNDGSYKIKKYSISVPKEININFLSGYQLEHEYRRLENGLWAPYKTSTAALFYLITHKRNLLVRQTKIYHGFDFDTPIQPSVFVVRMQADTVPTMDSTTIREDFKYWDDHRPEPLTFYERSVMDLVQEFKETPKFAALLMTVDGLLSEFVATAPPTRWGESKWDFGPIYSTASYNMLEGVRLRIGGTTTANVHPHWFFSGYAAYGIGDYRLKGNAQVMYSFNKKHYHQYEPLRHFISLTAQYDVDEPAAQAGIVLRDNILMSIPTATPVMRYYQYVLHTKLNYMKEWDNHLTLKTQFDFQYNTPAGSLRYDRVLGYRENEISLTQAVHNYFDYELTAELRYSPGRTFFPINRYGVETPFSLEQDAPVISLKHIVGFLDDRASGGRGFVYNHTQLTAEKRFWLSSFGHFDARVYGGWIWNDVPFTKVYSPTTSTGIFLGKNAFNLMQPMEFMMDRYVGWYTTYHLKGWILNRIPGINKLRLRGVIGFSGIWGALSNKNNPYVVGNEGLYKLPSSATFDDQGNYISGYTSTPIGVAPYMELTAGFENIFKFVRIDYIRRLNYNEYLLPDGVHYRRFGWWGRNGIKVCVRFEL